MEGMTSGDLDVVVNQLDEQVRVDDQDIPDAGTYVGLDGFVDWVAQWDESWEAWTIEDVEIRPSDEGAVALFVMAATGRGSGIQMRRADGVVFRMGNGKVTAIDYYNDQSQALQAAGLDRG